MLALCLDAFYFFGVLFLDLGLWFWMLILYWIWDVGLAFEYGFVIRIVLLEVRFLMRALLLNVGFVLGY